MNLLWAYSDPRLPAANLKLALQLNASPILTFGGPVEFLTPDYENTLRRELEKTHLIGRPEQIFLHIAFHGDCHFVRLHRQLLEEMIVLHSVKIPSAEHNFLEVLSALFMNKLDNFIKSGAIPKGRFTVYPIIQERLDNWNPQFKGEVHMDLINT